MARQKPVRTPAPAGAHYDYRESHPAYGLIGASRSSVMGGPDNGAILFGSDFAHQNVITITIRQADLDRSLHNDYIHSAARTDLIKVTLSEAQFAGLVSRMNMGDGVPCTIEWFNGANVPDIEPTVNRRAQLNDEVEENLREGISAVSELTAAIERGAGKKELRDLADKAKRELSQNLPWIAEQFDRHAEKTVERMKTEVHAYMMGAITQAGLQALQGGAPPLALIEGESVEVEP